MALGHFEIVERKGLGHPDSICDAVMERVSIALSQRYIQDFGRVMHHNCDKGLLIAGRAEHCFGGGRITEPMRLVIAGRALQSKGHVSVPVDEIAEAAARAWFREHLPTVDVPGHLLCQSELKHGSEQLMALWRDDETAPGANDTSVGVGSAPLTETETLVLEAERFLNSPSFKRAHPACGYDVKVMAVRRERDLAMTVAVPLIDAHVASEEAYFDEKEAMETTLHSHLLGQMRQLQSLSLRTNTLDLLGSGTQGVYLSVLGTSAEGADSGAVGRGNGVNGLISPCRPRGAEAAAGKNPVSHVGKIYNVLAQKMARAIHAELGAVQEATVWVVSRIGEPIDRPQVCAARLALEEGVTVADVNDAVESIVARELDGIPTLIQELIRGAHPIC